VNCPKPVRTLIRSRRLTQPQARIPAAWRWLSLQRMVRMTAQTRVPSPRRQPTMQGIGRVCRSGLGRPSSGTARRWSLRCIYKCKCTVGARVPGLPGLSCGHGHVWCLKPSGNEIRAPRLFRTFSTDYCVCWLRPDFRALIGTPCGTSVHFCMSIGSLRNRNGNAC
jgi:hypothetical protein